MDICSGIKAHLAGIPDDLRPEYRRGDLGPGVRGQYLIRVHSSRRRCCMNHIAGMVFACCLFVSCFFLSDTIRVCPNGSFD